MLPINPANAPKMVVAMPTANRPEFLALSLQRLSQSRLPDNIDIRIYADVQADLESVEYVRDRYFPEALIFQAKPHISTPSGCWNILNAIKMGYETGADRIFLLEEDVMVRPNFFDFHLSSFCPEKPDILASCGRKDPSHYRLYGPLYTNPGSCLTRELIANVVPHINDDFFARLRDYLDEHFGAWDTQSNLDDGLIRRVIRQMGGTCAYPDVPVAIHQGFRFYNKLDIYMNREVGIENRIARLKEIFSSIKPGDRYAKDFEPF